MFRTISTLSALALVAGWIAVPVGRAQLSAEGSQFWTQESTGIPGSSEMQDFMGTSTVAGDFNNDGFEDLAISIPNEAITFTTMSAGMPMTNTARSGRVVVLYGSATGLTTQGVQEWSKTAAGNPADDDLFGFAMAAADFNFDNFDDLAVSAPFGSSVAGEPAGGQVFILNGGPGGLSGTGSQTWVQGANELLGENEANDTFGGALSANDYNGDGIADLAIGIPGEDVVSGGAPVVDAGAVALIYGSATGLTAAGNQFFTETDFVTGMPIAGAQLGFSLASGDFNNDMTADLAVGAPGSGPVVGAFLAVQGSATGLDASTSNKIFLTSPATMFGFSMATGDINNDGFADLVIGAPGVSNGMTSTGAARTGKVYTYLGGAGPAFLTTLSQSFGVESSGVGKFGQALAIGDFNRDGFGDLAASVPSDDAAPPMVMAVVGAGSVVEIGGNAAGDLENTLEFQVFQQGIDGMLDTAESSDNLGGGESGLYEQTLAAGDFNGDGFADLAIGVPLEDRETPDAGTTTDTGGVHVLYGGLNLGPQLNQALTDLQGILNQLSGIPIP